MGAREWRYAIVLGVGATIVGCSLFDWASSSSDGGSDVVVGDAANDVVVGDATSDAVADADGGGAWTCESITSDPDIKQKLPTFVPTDYPTNGHNVSVAAGDNLQTKINAAQPGDVLELEAGATFTGPFKLPFAGLGWIVIRTATPDAQFAMLGTRVSPALAPKMAKLTAPSTVLSMANSGTGGYRIVGLELTSTTPAPLVDLSIYPGAHDVILDRVYAHGGGMYLNGDGVALVDSHVSGVMNGWTLQLNGGRIRITNNHLESPTGHVLIPSGLDFEICQNWMRRDPTADGGGNYSSLEIRDAGSVLIGGNIIETVNSALLTQQGTPTNVTMAYNHTTRVGTYVTLEGPMTNIVIHDNLFDSIPPPPTGADVIMLGSTAAGANLKFDHNTFTTAGSALLSVGQQADYVTNFTFTNNFGPDGQYGAVVGSGAGNDAGTAALEIYFAVYKFSYNAIWGNSAEKPMYPPLNYFPVNQTAVGFVSNTDWSLNATSFYIDAGSDGSPIGADITTLNAATAGVASP